VIDRGMRAEIFPSATHQPWEVLLPTGGLGPHLIQCSQSSMLTLTPTRGSAVAGGLCDTLYVTWNLIVCCIISLSLYLLASHGKKQPA